MHIFIKITFLTISFSQLQAAPVSEYILPKILGDETLASCKPYNSFLDSKNEYLTACNISLSEDNSSSSNRLLCLSFYDINLRLCEMRKKYTKLPLPIDVSQVVSILNSFDSDPSNAKDFCLKAPEQVSYGNSTKLLNYAEFQDSFNVTMSCNLMCIQQISPKVFKINPFCKIFLWGNMQLKTANSYLDNLAKTTQQSKTLGNNISKKFESQPVEVNDKKFEPQPVEVNDKKFEPQPVDVNDKKLELPAVTSIKTLESQPGTINESIYRTVERPQVLGIVTPGSLVASVTNILNTTPDNALNNSAKPAEAEQVVPAPMAVENPPVAPQPPANVEVKSGNANSNNQIDDPDQEIYEDNDVDAIENSDQGDPEPQHQNDINERPVQSKSIHKSSSSDKADKGIEIEKVPDVDTNPKMVITDGQFIEAENGHFFPFFLSAVALSVLAYVLLHNKKKVMALLIEGRQGNGGGRRRNSRGHAYRRLDTLEQAISSKSQMAPPTNIIY